MQLSLLLSVVMNKNKVSYSRHLLNPHSEAALNVKDLGSVGRNSAGLYHNKELIPLLDQEQLRTAPSTEEIWSRRKSLLQSVDDEEGICPCLARIFREQLEDMRRILSARGSVDLSQVSQIDEEQTAEPRRMSLPSRLVSILDNEQNPQHVNYQTVLKAYFKMKRSRCKCGKNPQQDIEIPAVKIIPSTPSVQELHLGSGDVEEVLPQVFTDYHPARETSKPSQIIPGYKQRRKKR